MYQYFWQDPANKYAYIDDAGNPPGYARWLHTIGTPLFPAAEVLRGRLVAGRDSIARLDDDEYYPAASKIIRAYVDGLDALLQQAEGE